VQQVPAVQQQLPPRQGLSCEEGMTGSLDRFLSKGPTLLATYGDYKVWEHPTMGDEAPLFLSTPDGRLLNTGFYDLKDFDLDLCVEILETNLPTWGSVFRRFTPKEKRNDV